MTKAERIRNLAEKHPEWRTWQIAAVCDCLPAYVRVVLRQRTMPGGVSAADLRWMAANPEKVRSIWRAARARYYEKNREKCLELSASYYEKNREKRNAYYRDYRARKKAEREASAPA